MSHSLGASDSGGRGRWGREWEWTAQHVRRKETPGTCRGIAHDDVTPAVRPLELGALGTRQRSLKLSHWHDHTVVTVVSGVPLRPLPPNLAHPTPRQKRKQCCTGFVCSSLHSSGVTHREGLQSTGQDVARPLVRSLQTLVLLPTCVRLCQSQWIAATNIQVAINTKPSVLTSSREAQSRSASAQDRPLPEWCPH